MLYGYLYLAETMLAFTHHVWYKHAQARCSSRLYSVLIISFSIRKIAYMHE